MTDIVTGNQIDIAAFDSGMSSPRLLPSDPNYRGPSPDEGRAKYDLASEAAMFGGIYKAVTNPIGTGLRALEGYGIATSTDEERVKDTMLESSIQKLNTMGNPIERTKNIVKGGKQVLKDVDNFINPKFAYEAVPVNDVPTMGIRQADQAADLTNSRPLQAISQAGKASPEYAKWREEGQAYYEQNKDSKVPMKGFRNFTDVDGKTYRLGSSHKGVLSNISNELRAIRDAKRTKTTEIPREEVVKIMEKYHQPSHMVDDFMTYQKAGKKKIDDLIKKINARIEANPEAYPGVKASLGHGKAANRYEHSADVLSNLDLENFFINVQRSNKDEISDAFNRGLGRSINLDEEVLKFIDKDLGKFFGQFGLGKNQKESAIKYVRKNMDKDINWKVKSDSGKQLFKTKEEYLINEALENVGFGKRGPTKIPKQSK